MKNIKNYETSVIKGKINISKYYKYTIYLLLYKKFRLNKNGNYM